MPGGRPPTELGTWGFLNTKQIRPGAFRARVRVRDKDGEVREVTAVATTKGAAERALRAKLVDRASPTYQLITADTRISKLAEHWLSFLRTEGRIEDTTINEYKRTLHNAVLPELGGLRLREVTTSRLEMFILGVRATSVNRQRKAKVVLGAMLDMAVRHDALSVNPVRNTARLRRPKPETRSLKVEDLATVRAAVRSWMSQDRPGPKSGSDMSDIVELMLATGARIGEVLALRWSDIELDTGPPNLTITGTIKTETGKGTYRKPAPKSDASVRTVVLPAFAVAILRGRLRDEPENPLGAVFATRTGTWHQVSNVERRWRQIRRDTGLEWVTPHTFRKTVATFISERVGDDTAAQQLGHSSPDITREFYISKPAIAADVAHILQELGEDE